MSMMLMARAFTVKVGNPSRKLVLLKLADNANDRGECWPSYQYIADQCEISRRSAMTHIEALCDEGLVEKISRKGPKGNSTNMYLVTLDGKKQACEGGEKSAPSIGGGGENISLGGENISPDGETVSLGGGENISPGISHSFESVSEPVSEPSGETSSDDSQDGDLAESKTTFPLKDGSEYSLPDDLLAEMRITYPAIDVDFQLKRARLWLRSNPAKRKTKRGMPRFLNGWMSRQQPTAQVHQMPNRHVGFNELDYSDGLIEGVGDDAANF